MIDLLKKLRKGVLVRTESGVYTLQGESINELAKEKGKNIDDVFGISQKRASFTPSKTAIEQFAASVYLFGLFGFKPENFTSIPVGYLVTFGRNNETNTLLIHGAKNEYYREILIDEITTKMQAGGVESAEKELLQKVVKGLKNGTNLLDICYMVSTEIEKSQEPWAKEMQNNSSKAIDEFNRVNQQNCDENHVLLHKECMKVLGYDEKTATPEQIQEAKILSEKILNEWILPAYLEYVGHDRQGYVLDRKTQIVSENPRVLEAFEIMKSKGGVAKVLTMSSTDYTADVVRDILKVIKNKEFEIYYEQRPEGFVDDKQKANVKLQKVESLSEFKQAVDYIAPETPYNSLKNKQAKKLLDEIAEENQPSMN